MVAEWYREVLAGNIAFGIVGSNPSEVRLFFHYMQQIWIINNKTLLQWFQQKKKKKTFICHVFPERQHNYHKNVKRDMMEILKRAFFMKKKEDIFSPSVANYVFTSRQNFHNFDKLQLPLINFEGVELQRFKWQQMEEYNITILLKDWNTVSTYPLPQFW